MINLAFVLELGVPYAASNLSRHGYAACCLTSFGIGSPANESLSQDIPDRLLVRWPDVADSENISKHGVAQICAENIATIALRAEQKACGSERKEGKS